MNILITGGTGTLGVELIKTFVNDKGTFITCYSRDPHKQATLIAKYGSRVRFMLGDVRDTQRLAEAMFNQQIVVHAAALKRVERGQTDASEYLSINIDGTLNVARAAAKARIDQAVFISSDKCVQPLNLYGISKAAGEHVWRNAAEMSKHTCFNSVRYGNVMGSNGSVWDLWQKQLATAGKIVVRAPEPTRFMMTKDDAVNIIRYTLGVGEHYGWSGYTVVPSNLPAFSLFDLARVVEPDEEKWTLEPMGSGEKQHEVLVAPGEPIEQRYTDYTLLSKYGEAVYSDVPAEFSSLRTPNRMTGEQVLEVLKRKEE